MISEQKSYARYITEQPPYNLLDRRIENELVPLALEYNLGLLPWSPLAMGILAGRCPLDGLLEMSLPDEDRRLFDELNPAGSVICDFHNTSGWVKMKVSG